MQYCNIVFCTLLYSQERHWLLDVLTQFQNIIVTKHGMQKQVLTFFKQTLDLLILLLHNFSGLIWIKSCGQFLFKCFHFLIIPKTKYWSYTHYILLFLSVLYMLLRRHEKVKQIYISKPKHWITFFKASLSLQANCAFFSASAIRWVNSSLRDWTLQHSSFRFIISLNKQNWHLSTKSNCTYLLFFSHQY